jgi:hypothetical protein
MVQCNSCGAINPTGSRFCGSCATPVPAEPVAAEQSAGQWTTPAGPPPRDSLNSPPTTARATSASLGSQLAIPEIRFDRLLTGDWLGSARIGLATFGTAALLAAALIAIASPVGLDTKQFLTAVAALTASAFGGDVVFSAGYSDSSQSASLGLYPLSLTLASLAVGALLYAHDIRRPEMRLGSAVLHAARAGLILGLFVGVMTLVLRSDLRLPSQTSDLGVPSVTGAVRVGVLPVSIFAFLYLFALCLAVCLNRRDWLSSRVLVLRDSLAAPTRALFGMLAVTCLVGIVAGVIDIIASHDSQDSSAFAALLAAAPNIGMSVMLLGSGAGFRFAYESNSPRGSGISGHHADTTYLSGLADQINGWVWLFPLATAVVLLSGAAITVWLSRSTDEARKGLLRWIACVVVATPLLVHLAAVHVHAASGTDGDFTNRSWNAVFGVSGWQAVLLMALWSFLAAVVVTAVLPAMMTRGRPAAAPTPPAWSTYADRG